MRSAIEPSARPAESFKSSERWLNGANKFLWWCHHHRIFTDSQNFHIKGIDNLRQLKEPTIIAFNHTSMLEPIWDAFVIRNLTSHPFKLAAMDDLWTFGLGGGRISGKVVEKLGGFPVKRTGEGLGDLIRIGSYALQETNDKPGEHVVIYPEGKLNKDTIVRPKVGTTALSAITGARILPVGQVGVDSHTGVYQPFGKGHVSMVFGEPIDTLPKMSMANFESMDGRERVNLLREWNKPLKAAMQAALDEARELHQRAQAGLVTPFEIEASNDYFPTIDIAE